MFSKIKSTMQSYVAIALLAALACVAMLAPVPAAQAKSYQDASGGWLNETTFVASGAQTASGGGTVFADLGAYSAGIVVINVTAVSGTSPTLTVNFKTCFTPPSTTSAPALSACALHTASASITATGVYFIKPIANFARWNTIDYTIGGTTPSFTFSVVGTFKPTS